MIDTIVLNPDIKLTSNGGLKQRKMEESESNEKVKLVSDQDNKPGEKQKEYVWEWEFDWWLIFYLITIHVCSVYGFYCLFLSKWLTILFSMCIVYIFF